MHEVALWFCGDSAAGERASPAAGIEKRIGELINAQRAAVELNGGGMPRKTGAELNPVFPTLDRAGCLFRSLWISALMRTDARTVRKIGARKQFWVWGHSA